MPSFAVLSVLATLACGAFAAPTPQIDASKIPVVGDLGKEVVGTVEGLPLVGEVAKTATGLVGGVAGSVVGRHLADVELKGAIEVRGAIDASKIPIVGDVGKEVVGTVEGLPIAGDVVKDVTALADKVAPSIVRKNAPAGLIVVLTGVAGKVAPLALELSFLNAKNATEAVVTPLVDEIKAALTSAVSDVKALVGQPTAIIMAAAEGEGAVAVGDLAKVSASLTTVLVGGLATLGKIAATAKFDVGSLVLSLGGLLGNLLAAVLALVDGLLASLTPLLAGLTGTLLSLNLGTVLSVLRL